MTALWIVLGVAGYLAVGCALARLIGAKNIGNNFPVAFALGWGVLFVLGVVMAAGFLVVYPVHRLAGGK
jgi:hypothetical protein